MKIEATKEELEILGRSLMTLTMGVEERLLTYDFSNSPVLGQKLRGELVKIYAMEAVVVKLWREAK